MVKIAQRWFYSETAVRSLLLNSCQYNNASTVTTPSKIWPKQKVRKVKILHTLDCCVAETLRILFGPNERNFCSCERWHRVYLPSYGLGNCMAEIFHSFRPDPEFLIGRFVFSRFPESVCSFPPLWRHFRRTLPHATEARTRLSATASHATGSWRAVQPLPRPLRSFWHHSFGGGKGGLAICEETSRVLAGVLGKRTNANERCIIPHWWIPSFASCYVTSVLPVAPPTSRDLLWQNEVPGMPESRKMRERCPPCSFKSGATGSELHFS